MKSIRVTLSIDNINAILTALSNDAIDNDTESVEGHRQAYNRIKKALVRNGYKVEEF